MGYIERYFDQVVNLAKFEDVCLVLTEGDSTDGTGQWLESHMATWDICPVSYTHFNHGGPSYGSVDHPERWAQISKAVRHLIDCCPLYLGEALVWVESDLIWNVATMRHLIERARCGYSVAPMVMKGNIFYDTWGFRAAGMNFQHHAPFWPTLARGDRELIDLDSCGSCFVLAEPDFKYFWHWNGMWPFRMPGLSLDTKAVIHHP